MKPLDYYGVVGAFVIAGYVIYAIRIGRVRFRLHVTDRKRSPKAFWWEIGVYLLLAGGFVFLAIKE